VETVHSRGRTRWTITVAKPTTAWRTSRTVFEHDVRAAPLGAGIARLIVEAIRRGEKLWDDE
jgi:hypothetical protein